MVRGHVVYLDTCGRRFDNHPDQEFIGTSRFIDSLAFAKEEAQHPQFQLAAP